VLWLLPVWLLLFGLLVGWGLFLIWLLRRAGIGGALSMFQTMWLGFAGLIAFLQLCSFVLPIRIAVLVLCFGPALAGYLLQRDVVVRRLRALRARARVVAVLACATLVAAVVVAYLASDYLTGYDTGFYHLQVMKWNAAYPVVPGLANLHLRFGYNNSVLLFGALTDALWEGVATHIMNGFLVAALLAHWFTEIAWSRGPRARLRQTFCLLALPFVLQKLWSPEVTSLSTDLPLALIGVVLVLELLALPRDAELRGLPIVLVTSLGAVAIVTKLGGAAMFAVAGVAALVVVRRHVAWRAALATFALPATLVAGWLVRGVITSGWLIFPVMGRIPVSWAVPREVGRIHVQWIESWARGPKQTASDVLDHGVLHWFVPWFEKFRHTHEMMLLLAACALIAWRVAAGPGRSAVRRAGEWGAVAACALGRAQWFYGAPDLRFGAFLFWLLPAAVLAPMLANAMRDVTMRTVVVVFSLALCGWSGGLTPRLAVYADGLWERPPDNEVVATHFVQTGPLTLVRVPDDGGERCGDAELPCTPEPHTQTQRDPDSLRAGFVYGKPR
jgi:hypothetical protein